MAMVRRQSVAARASKVAKVAAQETAKANSPPGSDAEEVGSQDGDDDEDRLAQKRGKLAQQYRRHSNGSSNESGKDPLKLPEKKTHHYYLSYEKAHSRYKKTPERLAKELYDALLLQGFSGYKHYEDTNSQSLASLKTSCTVIAMLHNEVFTDRCVMHWQVGKQERIPIIFVVDRSRNFTSEMQEEMADIDQDLLQCKWVEYTDGGTADCVEQVVQWLKPALLAPRASSIASRNSTSKKKSSDANKRPKTIGFAVTAKESLVAKKMSVLPGQPDDSDSSSSEDVDIQRCHFMDDNDPSPSAKKTKLMKRIESRKKPNIGDRITKMLSTAA